MEAGVQERGTMAMVIFGNIITSFSWFGVNRLGVGCEKVASSQPAGVFQYRQ